VLILLNPVIFSFGDCVTLALTWCQTLPGTRTDKKFSAEHVPEEKGVTARIMIQANSFRAATVIFTTGKFCRFTRQILLPSLIGAAAARHL